MNRGCGGGPPAEIRWNARPQRLLRSADKPAEIVPPLATLGVTTLLQAASVTRQVARFVSRCTTERHHDARKRREGESGAKPLDEIDTEAITGTPVDRQ